MSSQRTASAMVVALIATIILIVGSLALVKAAGFGDSDDKCIDSVNTAMLTAVGAGLKDGFSPAQYIAAIDLCTTNK